MVVHKGRAHGPVILLNWWQGFGECGVFRGRHRTISKACSHQLCQVHLSVKKPHPPWPHLTWPFTENTLLPLQACSHVFKGSVRVIRFWVSPILSKQKQQCVLYASLSLALNYCSVWNSSPMSPAPVVGPLSCRRSTIKSGLRLHVLLFVMIRLI